MSSPRHVLQFRGRVVLSASESISGWRMADGGWRIEDGGSAGDQVPVW